MSIRQLIKRFGNVEGGAQSLNNSGQADGIVLAPFSQMVPPTNLDSTRNMPLLDYYYYLYAFWRGSMRYKMFSETNAADQPRSRSNFNWVVSMFSSLQDSLEQLIPAFGSTVNQVTTALLPDGVTCSQPSRVVVDTSVEGLVEFEVPYYNISHISPATQYDSTNRAVNNDDILRGHIPPILVTLAPRTSPGPNNQIYTDMYKAAGDDFSLMYLVGVPPLVNIKRT